MAISAQSLINLALVDLGTIRPGETPSTTVSADCLLRLNQRLSAHSIEQLIAQTQVHTSYALQANVSRYTFGAGGTFTTGAIRPEKVTAWRAYYGNFQSGGKILTFDELQAVSMDQIGSTSAIPKAVGADPAYPLINIAVFPVPSVNPGTLELSYWIALTAFAALGTTQTFPDGWEDFLHYDLAVALLPRYGRQGVNPEVLLADAQNAKAKIVALNQPTQQQAA